jgi:hypothetical protein
MECGGGGEQRFGILPDRTAGPGGHPPQQRPGQPFTNCSERSDVAGGPADPRVPSAAACPIRSRTHPTSHHRGIASSRWPPSTFVWGLLIAVLYLLRPFLLLIFLTFVFAYIQAHGVDGLAHRIKNRVVRVVIVGLVFLGTLFATGFTLVPQVQDQANTFLKNKEKYVAQDADKELTSS